NEQNFNNPNTEIRISLVAFLFPCTSAMPCSSRASSRTLGRRSRVRRLQAGLVTPSQEARSSSAPDEGAAFGGWTRSDEGQRQCCLERSGEALRSDEESTVAGSKIATVECREACVPGNNGTRHLPGCQIATSAF